MKHFGAQLAGINNEVDGDLASRLVVGTASSNNDSIVIHNEQVITSTADKVVGTDLGLVIVPSATGRGATHVLGADGREVSIANISGGGHGSTFNETVDTLPVLGQNGSGAFEWEDSLISQIGGTRMTSLTVNGTLSFAVVSGQYNISLSIPTSAFAGLDAGARADFLADFPTGSGVGVPANVTIGGTRYFGTLDRTSLDAEDPITASFRGSSPFPAIASGTTVSVHFDGHESTHNAVNIAGALTVNGNTTITGNLVVNGDSTILNTATTVTEEKYLAVNAPDANADGNTETPASRDGGYLVRKVVATTLQDSDGNVAIDGDAANNTGVFGGIRFNEADTGGTGAWEVSQGTDASGGGDWQAVNFGDKVTSVALAANSGLTINGNGGVDPHTGIVQNITINESHYLTTSTNNLNTGAGDHLGLNTNNVAPANGQALAWDTTNNRFNWFTPSTGSGTVAKYAFDHSANASGVISIPRGAMRVNGTSHGLAGSDFTVTVYEYIASNSTTQNTGAVAATDRLNMIIPESIVIGRESGETGSRLDGTVTIQLPASIADTAQYRIVIKS